MSFDKSKYMRSAERFLAQGKISSAIGEYEQVIQNDPKDYNTLNMLGDLYIKNSDNAKAIECFTKVADHYNKQGFSQKAIAIYNKILRLQPDSGEIISNLAHLYQVKGSIAEARTHYKTLAANYEKKGQKTEALAIWKKIAEMDSSDFKTYLKIAQASFEAEQFEEAAKSFDCAGERAALLDNHEEAVAAFAKALEINPEDAIALNGLVKSQIELGFADEAAKKLEEALERQPNNKDIIYLLVDCYTDMNDPSQAERVILRLIEQEPANYPKLLELSKIYLKASDVDSATRILSMTAENVFASGQTDDFMSELEEILTRNPEQLDALRLLVRYHSWKREASEVKGALERLAEAARHQDATNEERYALTQLVMIEPQNAAFAERLQEIKAEYGDEAETEYEQIAVAELSAVEEESAEESAVFENFAIVQNEDEDFRGITSFERFESFYGENENAAAVYEVTANSTNGNGYHGEAQIVEDFAVEDTEEKPEDDEFTGEIYETPAEERELSAAEELKLQQELESVEFYIAQNYRDLAEKTLVFLEEEFGERPEIGKLRGKMESVPPPEETVYSPEDFRAEITVPKKETIEEIPDEPQVFSDYSTNAEIAPTQKNPESFNDFDEFKTGLGFEETEPAGVESDFETHYNLATAYKEMGLNEDAIREFQDAANLVRPNDGTRRFFKCANLLGLCFVETGMPHLALIWYQRAMETSDLNDEEKQALVYQVAVAYEAKGRDEKALRCYEQIYAIDVDYRDVAERLENLREKLSVAA